MITDEQVNRAIEVIKHAERHNVQACLDGFEKVGQHAITPEVFVRQLLNDYEQSKWVKLDVNDESSYPPIDQVVMCKPIKGKTLQMTLTEDSHPRFDGLFFEDERGFYEEFESVAYWQPLPEFED